MNEPNMKGQVEEMSGRLRLDADAIAGVCEEVLEQELFWFPVRHHSPTTARHLRAAIHERKPKVIFLEAPQQANHLLQFITDSATRPPVAIYSSYRDDDNVLGLNGIITGGTHIPLRSASWYPILSFSPEYIAMQAAKALGAKVVMMDLPHYALLKPFDPTGMAGSGSQALKEDDHDEVEEDDDDEAVPKQDDEHADPKQDDEQELDSSGKSAQPQGEEHKAPENKEDHNKPKVGTERLITESSFFKALAEVGGYRSFNECWDSLFECREFDGYNSFRHELGMFCAASRATSSVIACTNDGTIDRERFMMKTIKETMAAENLKLSECMVVCGGFHIFLDAEDTHEPPDAPTGTVYNTVVPYSYFRVSELSGYGAGNRAPRFYQTMWEMHQDNRQEDLLIEHVVDVIKQARKSGEPVSSADAISACQHANMLSRLRGRPSPILDDIHDAIVTCCCKGDPADVGQHLLKAIDHCDIGNKIGKVTSAVGQLPIIADLYKQLSDLDLGEVMQKEQRIALTLDRRIDKADRQSQFLHRIAFLELSLAKQTEAPSGDFATGMLFQEKWALRWTPAVESTLIEKNLYGDTIESASLALLRERLTQHESSAGTVSSMLANAANMNLPNLLEEVEDALSYAIDNDSRFMSLTQALSNLIVIERYAIYRRARQGNLDDLILRCFDRSCFMVLDIIAVPEDEQNAVVNGLLTIAEVLQRGDRPELDRNLFTQHLVHAAQATTVPFLRGVFLGLLTELKLKTYADLANEISALANGSKETMITAGDFLDGIIATSRASIMLGAKTLVAAVDELLRAADWDSFLTMLPRMRAAFERLHDNQVDSLAATVAQNYGLEASAVLTELRTSVGAAATIVRIDSRVATIMKEWDF